MRYLACLSLGLVACGGAPSPQRAAPPQVKIVVSSEQASEHLHTTCHYLGLSELSGDDLQTFAGGLGADHALPLGGREKTASGTVEVDHGVFHELQRRPRYESVAYSATYASKTVALFRCEEAD